MARSTGERPSAAWRPRIIPWQFRPRPPDSRRYRGGRARRCEAPDMSDSGGSGRRVPPPGISPALEGETSRQHASRGARSDLRSRRRFRPLISQLQDVARFGARVHGGGGEHPRHVEHIDDAHGLSTDAETTAILLTAVTEASGPEDDRLHRLLAHDARVVAVAGERVSAALVRADDGLEMLATRAVDGRGSRGRVGRL